MKYYFFTIQTTCTCGKSLESDVTDKHPFTVIKELQKRDDGYDYMLLFFKEIIEEEYKMFLDD